MRWLKIILILTVLIIFFIIYFNKKIEPFYKDKIELFYKDKKYKFCIMAIFKNEQYYLEEWITYHLNQGISHLYLYSNDDKLYNYPYLDKYIKYITLIPWTDKKNKPGTTIQREAYHHCVTNYGNECQYLMMLDIDEFISPTVKNERVIDIMNSLDNKNTKAIKVQRYNFGSNGHKTKPIGPVINNYFKREKICSSYKTIANTSYIDTSKKFYGVHDFPFINKYGKIYNSYFNYKYTGYPNGCNKNNINEIPLIINHYYTKSYEEYLKRCNLWKNGGVNNIGYRKNCKDSFLTKDVNEVDIRELYNALN